MSGPHHDHGPRGPVSVLEQLMRRKGVDEAWSKLEEMQRRGEVTDRFTVSRMLMKTVGDNRSRQNTAKVYRAISLVERFVQLQPSDADEVLLNALLDTCFCLKDLARLEQTARKMRELGIHPSHVTLGILVKAYGQAGNLKTVLKIWDEMHEQRRQANAVTYGCMIDACVRCGSVGKAMEIFEEMKATDKHRNTIIYTTLIKGLGLERDLDSALGLFREMAREGVPCNAVTYNSIIDVCIKCSNVQAAEDLVREMSEPGSGLEPDLITYSTLLKGYCHTGELDKALQVAETIKACGLCCDELVYNTLMDGCVKSNDLSAGVGLFAEMAQSGMQPSSITHSILVRLYQRNGYKAETFDAVAQLYQHHGLERPNGSVRGKWLGRRGDRQRGAQRGRGDRGDRERQGHAPAWPQGDPGSPPWEGRTEPQWQQGSYPRPRTQGGYGGAPGAIGGAEWPGSQGRAGESMHSSYEQGGEEWPQQMSGMAPFLPSHMEAPYLFPGGPAGVMDAPFFFPGGQAGEMGEPYPFSGGHGGGAAGSYFSPDPMTCQTMQGLPFPIPFVGNSSPDVLGWGAPATDCGPEPGAGARPR